MRFMLSYAQLAALLGTLLALTADRLPAQGATPEEPLAPPSLVEVNWKSSRTIVVPGVTEVVVLDEQIARAETLADSLRFIGLERGETLALCFVKGTQWTIRVRVVQEPPKAPPTLSRHQAEMAQGIVSSTAQVADSAGTANWGLLHGVSWSQLVGTNSRLNLSAQVEDQTYANGHPMNVRQASVGYLSPNVEVRALDFDVDLTGAGPQRFLGPFSFFDTVELRGFDVRLKRGANQYAVFGGTTVPYFFLTLGSTRDVAGFTFQRNQSENFSLFATSSYINAPLDVLGVGSGRRGNFMQTAGATYLVGRKWVLQTVGGASNHGGLARGLVSYNSSKLSGFVAAHASSALFPLNQIQSLFSGTSAIKGGLTYASSTRMGESIFFQHNLTQAIPGVTRAGSSDYFTPGVSLRLGRGQDVNFNYTYTRNSGGFSSTTSTGNRFDALWHSQLRRGISNSAQFTVGSLQDPLGLNSEDQFQIRDSLMVSMKNSNLFLGFEHSRANPSLARKLNAELGLLTPALQALFLEDPVGFVNSTNLPPEIRALLAAQQPIGTTLSGGGQFRVRDKLHLGPSVSVARLANGNTSSCWTPFLGYSLSYQVRPTLQFISNMNNVWVLANSATRSQRTTVLSFGFVKTFSAAPATLLRGRRARVIEGRVFRDNNINGAFNPGEPGFGGIEVRLENGDAVLTDSEGRYKFSGVSAGEHQVSISLGQFREPMRMATPNQVDVDLFREPVAIVSFGIVNFARVMGNVFNDLRFEGKRAPDARGLAKVRLLLDDGKQKRSILSQGTGDYEVDDVPPGEYTLSVDTNSVPANYTVPNQTFQIHVSPVSTVVQDVPVRALRSISGTVYLKTTPQNGNASGRVPMADVQITAGYGIVKTDANGNFILRDLPAGDLMIRLVPIKPLPEGMKVPSGTVHMPPDPVQVQDAAIVITNPELVPYLVARSAQEVRDVARRAALQRTVPSPVADPSGDQSAGKKR